jgi:hypothetical protein
MRFLCSCLKPVPSSRPAHVLARHAQGAVKAGRRVCFASCSSVARPRLDGSNASSNPSELFPVRNFSGAAKKKRMKAPDSGARVCSCRLNPKERRSVRSHGWHEQDAIEKQVPHFTARLCDEQAAMARSSMRRPIAASVVRLMVGADRIVRADP